MQHRSINRIRSMKKTKNSASKTSPKNGSEEITEEIVEKPNQKKKIWSYDQMLEIMKPTCEELDYRSGKSTEINPVEKYSKLFKCTKCQKNLIDFILLNNKVPLHPILGVLMCEKCCSFYEDGEFSLDSEGEDKYCRWCGEGGTLFTCSECISGFCANCIKAHFSLKFFKNVQKDENWLCFFCNPKPLWDQRYICSLAVQMAEEHETLISWTPLKRNRKKIKTEEETEETEKQEETEETYKQEETEETDKQEETEETDKQEETEETDKQEETEETDKQEETEESDESEESETEETALKRETKTDGESIISEGPSRTNKKRAYLYSSSSDETDCEGPKSPLKKFKFANSPLENLFKQLESSVKKDIKSGALPELAKLLKLAEYQMSMGISLCSDTLKKFSNPDYIVSQEGLIDECRNIKWFLSTLSTHLVQFTNSVDSIEKSLCQDDELKLSSDTAQKQQSPYIIILQFLNFVKNQVKTFVQKDLPFSDILDAPIYEDENIIGLKKSSSRNKNSDSAAESSFTNDDSEGADSKENEDVNVTNVGDNSMEYEADQNYESNLIKSENSSPYLAFSETSSSTAADSTQETQKLISILEYG